MAPAAVPLSIQAEAYAFRQLVEHLQWRSDVQNIDIMNLAGFCRNCLAKWYSAGSKVYGMPMTYDEACEHVYGEPYAQWKKKHQAKASDEQLSVFEASKAKHARTEPGPSLGLSAAGAAPAAPAGAGGHSTVCGQDCDAPPPEPLAHDGHGAQPVQASVAVLTCSDRAHAGVYEDKSGPMALETIAAFTARSGGAFEVSQTALKVLPDSEDDIADQLRSWSEARSFDVIFTTGGTGFGPRDITPEATKRVITRSAEGLSRAMAWQTSFQEPRSILSRGICGVTDKGVLVVNLPGNPAAVRQCLSVLLPVLPHALRMLRT